MDNIISILNNVDEINEAQPDMGYWLEGDSLAPPCQSEMIVVQSILELAEPYLTMTSKGKECCLFDLGCGDGRICISASKLFGCKSIGCEIEESLIEIFNQRITQFDLSSLVVAIHGDLRNIDLTSADVIVIYLLPEAIEEIKNILILALNNNTILICNTWGPKNLKPIKKIDCGLYNNVTLFVYDKSSL
eukprot:gene6933-9486_t